MHIRLIAIGDKQPTWVDSAFCTYADRLPRQWKFHIDVVATAQRSKSSDTTAAMEKEGRKVLSRIKADEFVVLLDERGKALTSRDLGLRLAGWQTAGRNLTFIIGGPDGVSDECNERADFRWSLSMMTLPHGLARVMFAEQLYRAFSLTTGHPYHRD